VIVILRSQCAVVAIDIFVSPDVVNLAIVGLGRKWCEGGRHIRPRSPAVVQAPPLALEAADAIAQFRDFIACLYERRFALRRQICAGGDALVDQTANLREQATAIDFVRFADLRTGRVWVELLTRPVATVADAVADGQSGDRPRDGADIEAIKVREGAYGAPRLVRPVVAVNMVVVEAREIDPARAIEAVESVSLAID
jgi:hypothetical protein